MNKPDFDDKKKRWLQATEALLGALPEGYADKRVDLREIDHAFRTAVAKVLEPSFNRETRARDRTGFGWRNKLARWANEEASSFGLAFLSPSVHCGSFLSAKPGRDRAGEFSLHHRSATARNGIEQTDELGNLPHLKLVPTPLGQPAWDRWAFAVKFTPDNRDGKDR